MTADNALVGYAEFIALCHVDKPANFGGFRVEPDGLYVDIPPADAVLTPEERAAVSWHPTGQYGKPALPLPCTLGQLRAFLPAAGMAGCIDEEAVDVMFGEESTAESGGRDGASKVGAGATAAIEAPKTKNWILLVQAEATKHWKILKKAGANPTKHNIKDDLSTWCRKTGVLTDGDINPSGDYIYRHVLRKWTPPTD
jgi:hypothetical protein